MTARRRPLLAAVLAAAALTTTSFAIAQPAAPAGPMHGEHMRAERHEHDRVMPGRFIEGRLAFLQTELKLTAAQQPLFDTLAGEMHAAASAMETRHEAHKKDGKPDRKASSVERMERRSAMMQEAAATTDRFLAAYKPLYAALSDEQKKTADLLFSRRGMMQMRHH